MRSNPFGSLSLLLALIAGCNSIPSATQAQALKGTIYTPQVGSDERMQLMDSVRIAMRSPTSKYQVSWLKVFHGNQGSVAVGTLIDVGASLPVGTIFFELVNGKWSAQYLVATDGSTNCAEYAGILERLVKLSTKVGASPSIFPPSFEREYEEAKSSKDDSCMGFRVWNRETKDDVSGTPLASSPTPLPSELATELRSILTSCNEDGIHVSAAREPGIQRLDLNGDGSHDVLFDSQKVCGPSPGHGCSNRGCYISVYKQIDSGVYRKVLNELYSENFISISKDHRLNLIAYSAPGEFGRCNKNRDEDCDYLLFWKNGQWVWQAIQ